MGGHANLLANDGPNHCFLDAVCVGRFHKGICLGIGGMLLWLFILAPKPTS